MQDLINSMVKFSAAMTLFGMQQIQNAVGAAVDTQSALGRFRDALDSVTNAITSQLDDSKKPTLSSMSNLGSDLVNRTWEGMNMNALDPRQVLESTGDLMRKTTDSLTDLVKKTSPGSARNSGEPQAAAQALSSN